MSLADAQTGLSNSKCGSEGSSAEILERDVMAYRNKSYVPTKLNNKKQTRYSIFGPEP